MKAAFFDVDETLIRLKSMVSFQQYYFSRASAQGWPMDEPFSTFEAFMAHFRQLSETVPRENLNRAYYQSFAGRPVDRITRCGQEWFQARLQDTAVPLWHEPGVAELRRCQRSGYRIVLVSGSFNELLAPIATDLKVDGVIATHIVREGNVFTGEITGTPCIGEGKAARIQDYALRHRIDLARSLAVGDHQSDIPMLESTGSACYVPGDTVLEKAAEASGWRPLSATSNGQQPLPVNL